jgi:hypothetical protein
MPMTEKFSRDILENYWPFAFRFVVIIFIIIIRMKYARLFLNRVKVGDFFVSSLGVQDFFTTSVCIPAPTVILGLSSYHI